MPTSWTFSSRANCPCWKADPVEVNSKDVPFQIVRYIDGDTARCGVLIAGRVFAIEQVPGDENWDQVPALLRDWDVASPALVEFSRHAQPAEGRELSTVQLLAPIEVPGEIFCAGANYLDHIAEMNGAMDHVATPTFKELGEKPWHFIKASRSAVIGPDDAIRIPEYCDELDWEIELAVIIGTGGRDIARTDALRHVAGYTIANDLSLRPAVHRHAIPAGSPFHFDFLSAKSFDGSCPLGPAMTPACAVPDPHALAMKLWVNDTLMQDSSTAQMMFSIEEQIEMISSRLTLHPGDVILTGTPAGVGVARGISLKPGDTVRMAIERIGEMTNQVI